MSEWISIKERVPPAMHLVMLYLKSCDPVALSEIYLGALKGEDGYWVDQENRTLVYEHHVGKIFTVTHWMPLPSPPPEPTI